MSDYAYKLVDKEFHNWLKTGLALHITKEGIEAEVTYVVKTFHSKCLNEVRTSEQISKNELCLHCSKKSVLPCQTRGICVMKSGTCSLHGHKFIHRPCPKGICDKVRDKIRKHHKYFFPSWNNTSVEKWCDNPWELAKCYMPPDGYIGVDSASETDLNGILSVMLNHTEFTGKVEEEDCKEARDICKKFRHSPNLCFRDEEVTHYLDTLMEFLTCTHHLRSKTEVQEAVNKIEKLKTDSLTLTTGDVTMVLNGVIHDNTKDSLHTLDQKQADCLQGISDALSKLQQKTSQSIADIVNAKSTAVTEIDSSKRAAIFEMQTAAKRLKSDTIHEVEKRKEHFIDDIQDVTKSAIAEIEEHSSNHIFTDKTVKDDVKLDEVMYCLQEDLVAFYRDEFESIPVTPLVPENDTKLMDFFVQPNMEEVDRNYQRKINSDGRKELTCCHDIFSNGSGPCQNIFLSAHAGLGKTTFAKHLCMIWCHCKNSDDRNDQLQLVFEDEVSALNGFDLLFFIFLRNEHGRECDVDEMIISQVISFLSRAHLYKSVIVKELLHHKKCLIILDGLDEWSHPTFTRCRKLSSIPHRRARPNSVMLYTTRPWKLHEAKISSSMIDKHIEMKMLKKMSVEKLTGNVIYSLNKINDKQKKIEDFQKLTERNQLAEFTSTPVILVHLICLWHDDRPIDGSKCQIYLSIIDFLFQHGELKINELKKGPVLEIANADCSNEPNIPLPIFCKKNYGLISALGELAFHTLFEKHRESSLVFERDVVNTYLTDDQLWCCLQMGLLTKNKTRTVSSREFTVSFIHKTFQEFFCALYIQSLSNIDRIMTTVLKVCCSIEKILEFSNIFVYLAGVCPYALTVLSEKMNDTIAKDALVIECRRDVLAWSEWNQNAQTLKEFQNMQIACVKECLRNGQTVHELWIEDFVLDGDFASQEYADSLRQLIEMNKRKIKSLNDIRTSGRQPKLEDIVDISLIEKLEKFEIFGEIDKDELDKLSDASLNSLICFGASCSIWEANRWIPSHTSLPEKMLGQVIKMIHLEAILLECLQMTHEQLEKLIELISMKRNMTQICLEEISCSTHGDSCQGLELDLSEHVDLAVFDIGTVPLSKIKLNATSLEKVGMGKLVSAGVQSAILDVLPKARNLKLFGCFDIFCEQDAEKFLNVLSTLIQLQFMVFKRIDIGDKLFEMSPEMKNLEYVQLEDMILSANALRKLLEKTEIIENAVTVVLRNCQITPVSHFDEMKNYIRQSAKFVVINDEYTDSHANVFSFKTWSCIAESACSV